MFEISLFELLCVFKIKNFLQHLRIELIELQIPWKLASNALFPVPCSNQIFHWSLICATIKTIKRNEINILLASGERMVGFNKINLFYVLYILVTGGILITPQSTIRSALNIPIWFLGIAQMARVTLSYHSIVRIEHLWMSNKIILNRCVRYLHKILWNKNNRQW